MRDRLHRYQTDPRFHALVKAIEGLLENVGNDFTVGELRDGFTTAIERREMLRVRPILVGHADNQTKED